MATRKKTPPTFVELETVEAIEILIEETRLIAATSDSERDRLAALTLVARLLEQRDKLREGVRRGSPISQPKLRAVPNS
jgi:hypothetical protein